MLQLTIVTGVLIAVALAKTPGANYQTGDGQVRSESISSDGSVRGQYSYIDPNGKTITTKYTAGKDGFKVEGDHIPKTGGEPRRPPPEADPFSQARLQEGNQQFDPSQGQLFNAAALRDQQYSPAQLPSTANAQFNPPQFSGFPQHLFAPNPNAIGQPASPSQLLQFGQNLQGAPQPDQPNEQQYRQQIPENPQQGQPRAFQIPQHPQGPQQFQLSQIPFPPQALQQGQQFGQLIPQAPQQGQTETFPVAQFPQGPQHFQYPQGPVAPRFFIPAPSGTPEQSQQFSGAPAQFPPSHPSAAQQGAGPVQLRHFQGVPQFAQPQASPSQFPLPGGSQFPQNQFPFFQFPQPSSAPDRSQDPTQRLGAAQFPTVPSSPQQGLPAGAGEQQYITPGGTQLIPHQQNIPRVPHRFN